MAYVEDLDNLEDVEDLNNCLDDENQELHEQIEPKIGMEFDGIVELYEFYKKYAKSIGFPMRKQSSRKNVEGNLRSVTLSCSRGGKRRITSKNPLKPQASCRSCRIGCTAYLTARLNLYGRWEITVVALDHNHIMSPGKSRFFHCNRRTREHGKSVSSSSAIAMADAFKLGFVGAGNMAESIARGVTKSGVLPPSSIRTAHCRPDRRDVFQSFGIEIVKTNSQVVDDSDIIILSVKPQMVKNVLLELKPYFSDEKVLVSVAAGIKLKELQEWSGHRRVIRVMPNTPSAVGEAASVMCMGEMATKRDEERVSSLFSAIGKIWTADEKYFDAVTGLSGSGPAYIFLAIEALADGGVVAGLPRDLALGLASQTVLGAAAMVKNTGKHPGQLKDAVTSPAGTTISGVHELERGGFRGTLMSAVVTATKRCRELSQM